MYYSTPLYNEDDPSGRKVSRVLDTEIEKALLASKSNALHALPYALDTLLLGAYNRGELSRTEELFIEPESLYERLGSIGSTGMTLLIYDISAINVVVKLPELFWTNSGSAGETIRNSPRNVNDFDTIWCRMSLYDNASRMALSHKLLEVTDETCNDEALACIRDAVVRSGFAGAADAPGDMVDVEQDIADQHWGKIIGSAALAAGGTALLIIGSRLDDMGDAGPMLMKLSGTFMIGGSIPLAIVGASRQMRYYRYQRRLKQ
jgi:hypothetical protein